MPVSRGLCSRSSLVIVRKLRPIPHGFRTLPAVRIREQDGVGALAGRLKSVVVILASPLSKEVRAQRPASWRCPCLGGYIALPKGAQTWKQRRGADGFLAPLEFKPAKIVAHDAAHGHR